MLIAVGPDRYSRGIDETAGRLDLLEDGSVLCTPTMPAKLPEDAKELEKLKPFYPASVYEVMHVDAMLDRDFFTDAHFVNYILHRDGQPLPWQPRCNKGGAEWIQQNLGQLLFYGVTFDVDNPGHAKWKSEVDAVRWVKDIGDVVPTAIIYATSAGARIVQPFIEPIPVTRAEDAVAGWFHELMRRGLEPDAKCLDWTRIFRAANVVRERRPYRTPALKRTWTPVEPIYLASAATKRAPRQPVERERRAAADVQFLEQLPVTLTEMASRLSAAAAPYVKGERHDISLRLAGALLKKGVHASFVPQVIADVMRPHSSALDKRVKDAQDTARKHLARQKINWDLSDWPDLDLELRRCMGEIVTSGVEEPLVEEVADVLGKLEATMRGAHDGPTLIRAQCGLGKTSTFRRVAAARASEGKKSALAAPNHKILLEQFDAFKREGKPVLRIFSPLSKKREDGSPECKYADVGHALAAGGISVAFALCRGCDYRKECKAVDGREGDEGASIALAPHELVGELSGFVGKTGLLAIDEPPPVSTVHYFDALELAAARIVLDDGWFDRRYTRAMLPIVDGVLRWLKRPTDGVMGPIVRGLTEIDAGLEDDAFEATEETDAVGWATAAMGAHRGDMPPLYEGRRQQIRLSVKTAERIGHAANVLGLLRRAVLDEDDVIAGVELRGTAESPIPTLVLNASKRVMMDALRRAGPTLVMAADADVIRPLLTRALGYEIPYASFRARESVHRTLWITPKSTRSGWLTPYNVPAIVEALERAIVWYLESPTDQPLAIVTYKRVAMALLGERQAHKDLTEKLKESLKKLPQPPVVGHFGNMRGINEWETLDALVTLGDPYPQAQQIRHHEAWIRSGSHPVQAPENWYQMHASAELEQAHGRLRTVHRSTVAKQLHVGSVTPAGWTSFEVRDGTSASMRKPGQKVDVRAAVERAGGTFPVARALGISLRKLQRWLESGKIPPLELQKLLAHCEPTPQI